MKLIKAGKIYTVTGETIDNGEILIDNGKIKEIGTNVAKSESNIDQVIDYTDKVILPGLIDAHSHVGVWGDGEGPTAYDGNEMGEPVNAKVRAIDATNPLQRSFAGAREGGITTLQIIPGSGNAIGGLAFACKTAGKIVDRMSIKNPTGLKAALGENPKRAYGKGMNKTPSTRMGTASLIREFFQKTKEYKAKKEKAESKGEDFEKDLNMEAGLLVLNREIPICIHAHRQDDIITAVRLSEEFDIDYTIEHCTDGHLIVDFLAEKDVTANVGPGLGVSSKVETADLTDKNPVVLAENGIHTNIITDHPFLNSKYFMAYGATVHKYGLSLKETLKTMTINPAETLGIADRVGSLEKGKDADLIVLDGEPFSYKSRLQYTFINGEKVYEREEI